MRRVVVDAMLDVEPKRSAVVSAAHARGGRMVPVQRLLALRETTTDARPA
ncbi:MAG: hypothetical protein IPG63_16790 [Xanthomonadales bacterium]|jgi:hypothetical protein|nr:hypothetical protein [Xanthomonadales bacterium]MBK7147013.1 hypothetical protein [Xanthomonadales bacterium]MCC6562419.1 hypothetical protein [Xanthomonadales bacterium]